MKYWKAYPTSGGLRGQEISNNAGLLEASQNPFYLLYRVQKWLALVLDLIVASLMVVSMTLFVKL